MNVIKTNFKYRTALVPLNLQKVFFIIIHHAASKTATPEQIHQWHLDNGWSGFGYNEYIRKDGTVFIGRGDNVGAQCANMNSKSYGICVEGDYDKETDMPPAQFNSLVERVRYNKSRFPNKVEIAPHSRFCATSCPGKYCSLERIIDAVNNVPTELMQNIDVLKRNGIIGSPQYWLDNAVEGKVIRGEFGAALIKNMASKLK